MRVVLPIALTWAAFAWYLGPAIDDVLSERGVSPSSSHGLARANAVVDPRSESTYQGRTARWWARRAVQARRDANVRGRTIRRLKRELTGRTIGPTLAIRAVFGRYAGGALDVAWCEGRWDPGARNGQYLGMFQLGSYARARYGHSATALGQARAAYAYFVDSGRDWSPWQCKP